MLSLRKLMRINVSKVGGLLPGLRKIHYDVGQNKNSPTKIDILVPWGKICGLWWGPRDQQPILALHGWQDTGDSFERLIQLLPKNTSVLAVDLPGHGHSDWIPAGLPYSLMHCVLLIHRISNFFGWDQTKLLGHSMGGMMVFTYATYFPNETKYCISLDMVRPLSIDVDKQAASVAEQVHDIMKLEARLSEPPGYTFDEIMHRWIKGADNSFDESACKILMKRGVKLKSDGKYCFSKDPRLIKFTAFDMGYTQAHILELAKRITCPYLAIKFDDSPYWDYEDRVFETIDTMKQSNPKYQFSFVEGKHHTHLTHPERVANVINPFLEKYDK